MLLQRIKYMRCTAIGRGVAGRALGGYHDQKRVLTSNHCCEDMYTAIASRTHPWALSVLLHLYEIHNYFVPLLLLVVIPPDRLPTTDRTIGQASMRVPSRVVLQVGLKGYQLRIS